MTEKILSLDPEASKQVELARFQRNLEDAIDDWKDRRDAARQRRNDRRKSRKRLS